MLVRSGQGGACTPANLDAALVPGIYAVQMLQVATRWQIEPSALLAECALSAAGLERAQARIPQNALWRLFERAIELTGEPGLSFHYGAHLKLSSHGAVGLAAMTAPTLRAALAVAERFLSLRAPLLSLRLIEEEDDDDHDDDAALQLSDASAEPAQRIFITEALFTALVQMGRSLLGRDIEVSFELAYPEPAHFSRFAQLWPGPARFGATSSRVRFARGLLSEPLSMADAVAQRQALEECERELDLSPPAHSLLASVRGQLAARAQGYPSLTELARERGASVRTIKRQLAAAGTSYQKLLDELRCERALTLLAGRSITIDEVAAQLGYSDAANFNRAFRRWVGCSPSDWRAQHVV